MEEPHEPTMTKLHNQLKRIHPGLVFEFEVQCAPRSFVVSADGDSSLFPTVLDVVERAPPLPGWKVLAFRQPGRADVSIEMRGVRLGPDDISAAVRPHAGLADITLFVRDYSAENGEALGHAAFILLDNALGEFLVETAIGGLELRPLAEAPADSIPMAELLSAVDLHRVPSWNELITCSMQGPISMTPPNPATPADETRRFATGVAAERQGR
jgi:hypothetical protein